MATAIADRDGLPAAEFTGKFLAENGHGSYWLELCAVMSWDPGMRFYNIPRLKKAGWVTYTDEGRSLRPGPRYEEGRNT
jgi:hypothetical protein